MVNDDDIFNALGFLGALLLACALLPRSTWLTKRRSTKDISYLWQAVYTTGLASLMLYYLHFQLWPVFAPMAFEFSCLIYLTSYKVYLEVVIPRREKAAAFVEGGGKKVVARQLLPKYSGVARGARVA